MRSGGLPGRVRPTSPTGAQDRADRTDRLGDDDRPGRDRTHRQRSPRRKARHAATRWKSLPRAQSSGAAAAVREHSRQVRRRTCESVAPSWYLQPTRRTSARRIAYVRKSSKGRNRSPARNPMGVAFLPHVKREPNVSPWMSSPTIDDWRCGRARS
jgi:hypothetical protein